MFTFFRLILFLGLQATMKRDQKTGPLHVQAFYSGRNLAGNPVTTKLRKKLDEATNAQSEGGDIVDAFLENEGLVGLIAPGNP
jgi:hypothetical protein